jgi:hypothetical protein
MIQPDCEFQVHSQKSAGDTGSFFCPCGNSPKHKQQSLHSVLMKKGHERSIVPLMPHLRLLYLHVIAGKNHALSDYCSTNSTGPAFAIAGRTLYCSFSHSIKKQTRHKPKNKTCSGIDQIHSTTLIIDHFITFWNGIFSFSSPAS